MSLTSGGISAATSVIPTDSVSNIGTDVITARELSITKRRQTLKDPGNVWYHFEKGRKKNAVICDYCDFELPLQKQSGTNTYWRHLQQKHRDKHDEAKPDKKQRKLDFGTSRLGLKPYFTQNGFEESLVELFVQLNLPFHKRTNYKHIAKM